MNHRDADNGPHYHKIYQLAEDSRFAVVGALLGFVLGLVWEAIRR